MVQTNAQDIKSCEGKVEIRGRTLPSQPCLALIAKWLLALCGIYYR